MRFGKYNIPARTKAEIINKVSVDRANAPG
jgi:hypothetical protein